MRDEGAFAVIHAMERERVPCAYLDLSMCSITNKGATAVARLLEESQALTELRLQSNLIEDEGAGALPAARRESHFVATC